MFSISTAAGLLALSSAEVFEFSDLEVATDRWFYPFNATPGDRILASTFGQDIYTVFDDRDGQFLLTFDLTELGIATPIDPNQITFEALRLEVNYEGTNPVVYDNTIDDPSTFGSAGAPDVDAGRPLELWAVGWRDGWTAGTFPRTGRIPPMAAALAQRSKCLSPNHRCEWRLARCEQPAQRRLRSRPFGHWPQSGHRSRRSDSSRFHDRIRNEHHQ